MPLSEADEARYCGDSPIGGSLLAWVYYWQTFIKSGRYSSLAAKIEQESS